MDIRTELEQILAPDRIKTRSIDLVAYASDAGFYHLVPKAVVLPNQESEIQGLFEFCKTRKIPITFRTGGTSLSGQSISDGILADLSQHWRKVEVIDHGKCIQVQPGVIGHIANMHLKKYQRKIGPDPSSITSAMMGGIISNNSSGMCCGVNQNAYHTLKDLVFILPSGHKYHSGQDHVRFEQEEQELFQTLLEIRSQILDNIALREKIRNKYQTKNTVGYGINAFLDYKHPLDIFAHLLVGAEGTLAFIAEANLETVEDFAFKSTAMLYFEDMGKACEAIVPLIDLEAQAVELMDRASLRSIEHLKGVPEKLKDLPENAAALLIEFQSATPAELQLKVARFTQEAHEKLVLLYPDFVFTEDPKEQAFLWKLRKGMFPSVGAVRAQGTTVLLEDIAFPVAKLAPAVQDLQVLFHKYHYDNAIIFGHAKDGNIHFVVTQSFNTPAEIKRYESFMEEVVHLVVNKYQGTLKAEHGTGRNMAPFVETEWGHDAYLIMKKIKETVDPEGILNPGVIINPDTRAHLKNLKTLPIVEEEVDKCIECGYCEHTCPSKDLTMTPRRRIVVRREIQRLKASNEQARLQEILKDYEYDGLETCAVDGLCATHCPVDINTGDLVKRLRRESHHGESNKLANWTAQYFSLTEGAIKFGLKTGHLINRVAGNSSMRKITQGLRKMVPSFPLWVDPMPKPISFETRTSPSDAYVYYPTCITRAMGNHADGKVDLVKTIVNVAQKAGINIKIPLNTEGTCCGQPYSSKGFSEAFQISVENLIEKLDAWSEHGKLPILLDGSSCTYTLIQSHKHISAQHQTMLKRLTILDSVDFAVDHVLPKLKINNPKTHITFHPVCSLTKMGIQDKLHRLGQTCAEKYTLPLHAGCCGMAGDRGFLFPELTQSASKEEVKEVKALTCDGHYSSGKTCELSMSHQSGFTYESIFYLLDEVSTAHV